MRKVGWVFDCIYRQNFYFYLGFTKRECEKAVERDFGLPFELGDCSGRCFEFTKKGGNGNAICIWVPNFKKDNLLSVSVLMHECIHAAMFCFDVRGIEVSTKYHESLAYYSQWIFKQALGVKK